MIINDLDAWLLDVTHSNKPSTVRFYSGRSQWIRRSLGIFEWSHLNSTMILRSLDAANRWPDQRHKAPDTQRANAIAWEQFQQWALATGRCEKPVLTEPLKKPAGRQRDRLPSIDEVQIILATASTSFRAIYRALLLTGARPGELAAAQVTDFDTTSGVVLLADHKTVKKTKRPRTIPIGTSLRPLFEELMDSRTTGPIFRTPTGQQWTTERLSQNFRRLRDKLKLDRSLVLYLTRHKFATELCHARGIEAAAAVLGHSGLQTIRRYVHHDTSKLIEFANSVDSVAMFGESLSSMQ